MAKAEWLNDVVKVLRATPPPLPGDEDPALKVLDRVVEKLYSTCWNDGPVGKDGCPVCRAYQTEEATRVATYYKEANQELAKVAEDATQAHETAEAEKEALAEALEDVAGKAKKAIEEAKAASDAKETALVVRDEALAERASAQRQAEAARAEQDRLSELCDRLSARVDKFLELARKAGEV